MKKVGIFLWLGVVWAFGVDILPLSNVVKGIRGIGYSVFQGWEPVSFDVEIVDVMRGTTPDDTLILARLSGQNLETTGVVAGMSGSPVYVNGKLVGAVAYSWSFAKDTLCGITPIESMLAQKELSPVVSLRKRSVGSFPFLWGNFERDFETIMGTNLAPWLREVFSQMAVGRGLEDGEASLKAGDSVAVHLVDGDVQIQAIGTVTAVDGKRVLMFGHSLFQLGRFEAPFSRSYVYGVLPSYAVSFKLGTSGKVLGSVVYDGMFAVEGEMGKQADMIVVSTTLASQGKTNAYRYRVVRSSALQTYFLLSSLSSLLQLSFGTQEKNRFSLAVEALTLAAGKTNRIRYENQFFLGSDTESVSSLLWELWDFFDLVGNWQRENVRLEQLDISIQKEPLTNVGFVDKVWLERDAFSRGEAITVNVLLRDALFTTQRLQFRLDIPFSVRPGKYFVLVGDAQSIRQYVEREYKIKANLTSYYDVLRFYEEKRKWHANPYELWAVLLVPDSAFQTEKGILPSFPKQYWERLQTAVNVGREMKTVSLVSTNITIRVPVFSDLSILPLVVRVTNEGRNL